MASDLFKKTHFECECDSDEHTFTVRLDTEDGVMYTSVYLNQYHGFFARCWLALKYVFGYRCKYGHWDSVLLSEKEATKLRDLCNEAIAIKQDLASK